MSPLQTTPQTLAIKSALVVQPVVTVALELCVTGVEEDKAGWEITVDEEERAGEEVLELEEETQEAGFGCRQRESMEAQ